LAEAGLAAAILAGAAFGCSILTASILAGTGGGEALAAGFFAEATASLLAADAASPLTGAATALFSIVSAGGWAARFAVRLGRKSWLAVMTFPLGRIFGLAFLDRSACFLVPFRT
jgi:hypothetical protein